mgnify:FL=1|tara:strand:+ start:1134 stop:1373 length:240 start_codon:yes stop_codon:yes gene_type:complete
MNKKLYELHYAAHVATVLFLVAIFIMTVLVYKSTKTILVSINKRKNNDCPACNIMGFSQIDYFKNCKNLEKIEDCPCNQ